MVAQAPEAAGMLARPDGARVAWRRLDGRGPAIVWLGGLRSDMTGTKAQAVADWALAEGRAMVRFDYYGHGASSGDFADGTIGRWLQDSLVVIDWLTKGPVVLAGSSLGGWLACLAALERPDQVAGLALMAPAADFTDKLLEPSLGPAQQQALRREGWFMRTAPDDPVGYPITQALLREGRRWSILPGPTAIRCPVRILHGGTDTDVPWTHSLRLAQAIQGEDLVFTLIQDGDHRLSRPQDLRRLLGTLDELCSKPPPPG